MEQLTKKQIEILQYIYMHGKTKVLVNQNNLNQNVNFFARVSTLEKLGYIIVQRDRGFRSHYTLTNKGIRYFEGDKKPKSDVDYLNKIIKSSNLTEDQKKHILSIIN